MTVGAGTTFDQHSIICSHAFRITPECERELPQAGTRRYGTRCERSSQRWRIVQPASAGLPSVVARDLGEGLQTEMPGEGLGRGVARGVTVEGRLAGRHDGRGPAANGGRGEAPPGVAGERSNPALGGEGVFTGGLAKAYDFTALDDPEDGAVGRRGAPRYAK